MNRRDWIRLSAGSSLFFLSGCAIRRPALKVEISSAANRMLSSGNAGYGVWQGVRQIESGGSTQRLGSLSLTKSIAALAVVKGVKEGWLSLDASLTDIIPEWRSDSQKSRVTLRMLVNQTAGFAPSPEALYRGKITHKGKVAVSLPIIDAPGTRFRYGPASWEIIAEILQRKLSSQGSSLEKFIGSMIRRIGLSSPDWRKDGQERFYLSTGAQFSVRDLSKLGRTLGKLANGENDAGLDTAVFRDLSEPRLTNPMFGAGIWWNRNATRTGAVSVEPERVLDGARDPSFWRTACLSASSDPDWFALVGSGGKRVYVLPKKDLVIVRLGRAYGWNDGTFLRNLSV